MPVRLYIQGLSPNVSSIQLRAIVREYAEVLSAMVLRKEAHPMETLALLEVATQEDADRVRHHLPVKISEPFLSITPEDTEPGQALKTLFTEWLRSPDTTSA